MLWRATLCYDALQRPLAAQPEAQAAVPAPAAQRAENAAVAKAAQGAAAEEPAGGRKRARPQGASSSGDSLQRSKRLAPDTESQEHEPPPAPASQPSSQEDARSGSGSQGGEAGGGREADSGGSQGSAGAPTDLQVWGLQILTRRRFCGSWSRGEPWEQVEAARQAEREQWVAEVKADRAQETDEQVEAALSFVQAPLALPLAEPEGAEALAARLLAATASARQ